MDKDLHLVTGKKSQEKNPLEESNRKSFIPQLSFFFANLGPQVKKHEIFYYECLLIFFIIKKKKKKKIIERNLCVLFYHEK